jgi:hypothetical protein
LAQKKFLTLPELQTTLVEPDPHDPAATVLELDELWSFVLKKTRKRWIWIALCRATRQVVAYCIGDRKPCHLSTTLGADSRSLSPRSLLQ